MLVYESMDGDGKSSKVMLISADAIKSDFLAVRENPSYRLL